jgi:hypothetical protein
VHSSLNHQYRLVWSDAAQSFVAVAENTKGRGKQSRSGRAARLVSAFMVSGALSAAAAGDLPTGDIFDSSLPNTVLGFRPIEHQCQRSLP